MKELIVAHWALIYGIWIIPAAFHAYLCARDNYTKARKDAEGMIVQYNTLYESGRWKTPTEELQVDFTYGEIIKWFSIPIIPVANFILAVGLLGRLVDFFDKPITKVYYKNIKKD